MKKTVLALLAFLIFKASAFSIEIKQEFPNTIVPISNISIERLWQAAKDDSSMEDYYYQQEIYKIENEYKKTLSTEISDKKKFSGVWYLTDSQNLIVKEYKIAPIQFEFYPEGVIYRCQSSTSYVYEIEKDSYLIIPTWDAGMIRLLKIFNDKLYIYNLDGDTWYLDDIHKSGNYYKRY